MENKKRVYYSEAQIRAYEKYENKFDSIKLRVPAGKKEEYKQAANAEGKSLNQYIIDCIEGRKA